MNRFDGNILSTIAKYATPEEVFCNAAISKIWSEVMEDEKEKFFRKYLSYSNRQYIIPIKDLIMNYHIGSTQEKLCLISVRTLFIYLLFS